MGDDHRTTSQRTVAVGAVPGAVGLGACRARHHLERRGSGFRGQHAVEDPSGIAPVFGPVGSVDFGIETVAGVDERDVLPNSSGLYPTFVLLLGTAKPVTLAPSNGSDGDVVAERDDPDGHRFSQRAVAPDGRDLHFFSLSDLVELVACPLCHRWVFFGRYRGRY